MPPDPDELVHWCNSPYHNMVFHLAVAGKHCSICHDDLVAKPAVMRNVYVSHDEAIGAHHGATTTFLCPPVHGCIFADNRTIAYFTGCFFAGILEILRLVSHDRTVMDLAGPADPRPTADQGVGPNHRPISNHRTILNNRERTNRYVDAKGRIRAKNGAHINLNIHKNILQ
jgi:hypothetical protein